MTFDHFLRPDLPEARSPEWTHGLVMGLIPAVLTGIETGDEVDHEGLGRIRVRCDLISPVADLPNSYNGLVWVLEDFVTNGREGGAHRFLEPGSQIVLGSLFGNPQQMVLLGCIHSRIDRPNNNLFDRSAGIYGTQTPNNVFSVRDDVNASRTDAYPHGVTQQVSANGDIVQQTQDHARLTLQQNGTTILENDLAATVTSAEGEITQRSAGGAIAILGQDGDALIRSEAFDSELRLTPHTSVLTGPIPAIGSLINQAKTALGGLFGEANGLIEQLTDVTGQLQGGDTGDLDDLALTTSEVLTNLEQATSSVNEGIAALEALQNFSIENLGSVLLPQVQAVLNNRLHELLPELRQQLRLNPSLERINRFLEEANLQSLPERLSSTLEVLNYDLDQQAHFVLSHALPDGYESFANLAGLKLHDVIGNLQLLLLAEEELPTLLQDQLLSELEKLLPASLRSAFQPSDWLEQDLESALIRFLGRTTQSFVSHAIQSISASNPYLQAIPHLRALAQGINQGRDLSELISVASQALPSLNGLETLSANPAGMIEQLIAPLTQQLQPQLGQSVEAFTQVMNVVPSSIPRPEVRATAETSELRGALGLNRVYADSVAAGIRTPHGSFGLGSGGGIIESFAPLVMRVASRLGGGRSVAGIEINRSDGALLRGYEAGDEAAQVQVNGNVINIRSGNNRIVVDPSGIWINEHEITQLFDLYDRFNSLESRLYIIEASRLNTPTGSM